MLLFVCDSEVRRVTADHVSSPPDKPQDAELLCTDKCFPCHLLAESFYWTSVTPKWEETFAAPQVEEQKSQKNSTSSLPHSDCLSTRFSLGRYSKHWSLLQTSCMFWTLCYYRRGSERFHFSIKEEPMTNCSHIWLTLSGFQSKEFSTDWTEWCKLFKPGKDPCLVSLVLCIPNTSYVQKDLNLSPQLAEH